MAWLFAERLANALARGEVNGRLYGFLIPLMFGAAILVVWEAVTRGANVPNVLLPPPSRDLGDAHRQPCRRWPPISSQTFLKAVLAGYVLGCGSAFVVAIAIDRSPFLKRGLLPIGNFVSALPIIGIAPIMVMWFGFDWQSKAAVVVIMTFFPMLVNTVAGLNASGSMERDMMRTYAAGYWQTLFKLRLPAAAPFIFNALKINSTLALIGAIVAEFFGTPIVGMGFRISTEVGKLNVDHGLGGNRRGGGGGLRLLRGGRPYRAGCHLLASVRPWWTGVRTGTKGNDQMKKLLVGLAAGAMALAATVGYRRRCADAAAQMGHPGPVRRLFRRQGQGLLHR